MRNSRRFFLRNLDGYDHLEMFVVSAVTAILAIRLFLHLTGYPQIGGEEFHIAHLLWGGLLMLLGFVIVLAFLGEARLRAAAVLGGLGFGTFIDEVGKFVTRDSDYFFEPAVAIMYVTFVSLLIAGHLIHGRGEYSGLEYLLNALREMEELARHDLDEVEAGRARRYLEQSEPGHPLVAGLMTALHVVELRPPRPTAFTVGRERLRALYRKLVRLPWFDRAIILVFVGQLAVKLLYGALLVYTVGLRHDEVLDWRFMGWAAERTLDLSGAEMAQLVASGVAGVFVLLGVTRVLKGNRLAAFHMFERAILVSILLVQVFSFYQEQFAALVELLGNLSLLVLVRSMIRLETEEREA
ncbi:MAG: hypothetical protein ACREMK_01235 [Gemmatimonadota bacterium]